MLAILASRGTHRALGTRLARLTAGTRLDRAVRGPIAARAAQAAHMSAAPGSEDERGGLSRVAIIGSGPAGFYTAKYLLSSHKSVRVDVLDALPTPFGAERTLPVPGPLLTRLLTRPTHGLGARPGTRMCRCAPQAWSALAWRPITRR